LGGTNIVSYNGYCDVYGSHRRWCHDNIWNHVCYGHGLSSLCLCSIPIVRIDFLLIAVDVALGMSVEDIGCLDGLVSGCTDGINTATLCTFGRACDGLIVGTLHSMGTITAIYGYTGALQMYIIEPTLILLKREVASATFHTIMKRVEIVTCFRPTF